MSWCEKFAGRRSLYLRISQEKGPDCKQDEGHFQYLRKGTQRGWKGAYEGMIAHTFAELWTTAVKVSKTDKNCKKCKYAMQESGDHHDLAAYMFKKSAVQLSLVKDGFPFFTLSYMQITSPMHDIGTHAILVKLLLVDLFNDLPLSYQNWKLRNRKLKDRKYRA